MKYGNETKEKCRSLHDMRPLTINMQNHDPVYYVSFYVLSVKQAFTKKQTDK